MKIAVIGTGYVGLVTGAVFSNWGHTVICADIDEKKIEMINNGAMPIYEEGLEELIGQNVKEERIFFTTDVRKAVKESEIIFIGVGTPSNQSGSADLSSVWAVSKTIGESLNGSAIVVTKSTVPVGTNESIKRIIEKSARKGAEFSVVSNPEFLREGSAIYDANNPDRVILGSDDEKALEKVESLYKHLNVPILKCDFKSAELIKYASNAFLATKISFINEISRICDRCGADVSVVADGMGYDKRIGRSFLNASIGYGGSCFPKDVSALYRTSSDQEYDFRLLRGVMDVNEQQKKHFIEIIVDHFGGSLVGKTLACLGAAFKGNTDDTRKSPAIEVIKVLRGEGAEIRLYDPAALKNAKTCLGKGGIYYAKDSYDALKGADALCILTEWKEFGNLDLKKVKKLLTGKVIFDGRNIMDPEKAKKDGFVYRGIGRK